jgi:hypothetical protein
MDTPESLLVDGEFDKVLGMAMRRTRTRVTPKLRPSNAAALEASRRAAARMAGTDRGWRQGSTFPGSLTSSLVLGLDPPTRTDIAPPGDLLVLTTQDCDLVKAEDKIPALEVVIGINDDELAKRVRPNNGRYFVMDRESGIVADRAHKVPISRAAINSIEVPPVPFSGDPTRAASFARWLAATYDRPALPDEVHRELHQPLVRSLGQKLAQGAELNWLDEYLLEVRVSAPFTEPGPWSAELLFVLTEAADVDRCEEAIASAIGASGLMTPPNTHCVLLRGWATGTLSSISASDYLASHALPL